MNAEQKIKAQVAATYDDTTPHVYKGVDYDGARQAFGWWYRPFNGTPIFLGKSLADALEHIELAGSCDHD